MIEIPARVPYAKMFSLHQCYNVDYAKWSTVQNGQCKLKASIMVRVHVIYIIRHGAHVIIRLCGVVQSRTQSPQAFWSAGGRQ